MASESSIRCLFDYNLCTIDDFRGKQITKIDFLKNGENAERIDICFESDKTIYLYAREDCCNNVYFKTFESKYWIGESIENIEFEKAEEEMQDKSNDCIIYNHFKITFSSGEHRNLCLVNESNGHYAGALVIN